MSLYTFLYSFCSPFFKGVYRVKIHNPENEPKDGACIFCSNHTAAMDAVVIGAVMKKPVSFFAKASLFKVPVIGWLVKGLDAISVNRGANDINAIKNIISALHDGKRCGIFPQGTRMPYVDPKETEIKSGIGMIEWRAKVTIVPVFIQTKKNKLKLLRRTHVIIGKPIPFDELPYTDGKFHDFQNVSQYIFDKVCELESDEYFAKKEKNS